jgi:hypothetical protein
MSEGSHTLTVEATDVAGNTSEDTTRSITVDTVAPTAPVVSSPVDGSMTTDKTPAFNGTAEAGSIVTVMAGETELCRATVASDGSWNCTPTTGLSEGDYDFMVEATDPVGNTSTPTQVSLTITKLAAPTINALAKRVGRYPVVSGHAAPGSIVTLTIDQDNNPATNNDVVFTTTANSNGDWAVNMRTSTPASGTLIEGGIAGGNLIGVTANARDTNDETSVTVQQVVRVVYQLTFPIMSKPANL